MDKLTVQMLQGNKLRIWEELSFPRTLKTLYRVLPDIAHSGIRRCLYEMRDSGLVTKNPEKLGVSGRNKWRRTE